MPPKTKATPPKKTPKAKETKSQEPKVTPAAKALDKKLLKYLEEAGQICYPVQVSSIEHCLSSGLLGVDLILCGGFRRGRFYTITGMPSDGKSTFLQENIAQAQREHIRIFHFDMEGGASRKYMKKQGVISPDEVETINGKEFPKYRLEDGSKGYYYFQPESGDECYQMMANLLDMLPAIPTEEDGRNVDGKPTTLVVIDSYESMVSEDIKIDQNPIGAAARMHSRYQKLIRPKVRRAGACLVAANQLRMKVMAFGDPVTDGGGLALQFYADAKVRVHRRKEKKEGERFVSEVKFKCVKNKMNDPFYEYMSRLIIGRGFDKAHDRLEFLTMSGEIELDRGKYIIEGKTYNYGNARKLMRELEWKKKCKALSKKQATYDYFFQIEEDEKDAN